MEKDDGEKKSLPIFSGKGGGKKNFFYLKVLQDITCSRDWPLTWGHLGPKERKKS